MGKEILVGALGAVAVVAALIIPGDIDPKAFEAAIQENVAAGKIVVVDSTLQKDVEAKVIEQYKDTIPAVKDTAGKVLAPEKIVDVPRHLTFPMITIPARGWIVLDADKYQPVVVTITQGDITITRKVDVDMAILQEAGNACLNMQINVMPLNGTKTRGLDSLAKEDL